jgi:hypothetical protein
MAGLPFHPEELTEQQRPLGFAGSPRSGQSATAGEFRDITWNKTDLVHDLHSFYLFDFRNLDKGHGRTAGYPFLVFKFARAS